MRAILLCGGSGSRLYPTTKVVNKQLLPIYDKPMVYYPLSILLLAGIREILIISTEEDISSYKNLFEDGSQLGIHFEYVVQPRPEGIAQAFLLAEDFLEGDDACLILGDNIFHGQNMAELLMSSVEAVKTTGKAQVFGYHVEDPERFGVADFDPQGNVIKLEEKPTNPTSNYAVVGLYFYPGNVVEVAKKVKPSARGELEITSVNQAYLKTNQLKLNVLDKQVTWLDTGTHETLLEASNFIKATEQTENKKIACIEEIAYEKGYIDQQQLTDLVNNMGNNNYSKYLASKARGASH